MTKTTTAVSDYIANESWPCRHCLAKIIDCKKPDGSFMKIAAYTDPSKLELDPDAKVAHKALMLAPISLDLPEHKYGIAVAAQDLLEHLCPEGKNFRLGMKALAEDRRFEVRNRHEMTNLGMSGTDVPDPDGYPKRFPR